MRKIQQARILELLQTLKEANDELKKQPSPDVLCGLLGDVQNFALRIGKYIESIAGEGTNTVSMLEAFCATVREAYSDKSVANRGKRLRKQIIAIENSVYDELEPDRIEAVFFPYKASMADSLRTIWEAAMADPDCDAVICPIPYFDRLPDGTLGEMHYEGGAYPNDLPIADWRKYDIETRRPDIVYIHNPYDDGNYVTSVHPDFYSKRLREFTDMLVYVPYFVVTDNVSEPFCTTAGCVYAHKVIVQSERVRETYIRVFKEAFGDKIGRPEDKFVALGSPKFDAVVSTKREDCELPEEWERVIGGKKVVLYNTTVGAMLQGGEQYLKKIRSVLEVFRARDDIVLWWRPHPLSESTLESMRPGLSREYREIAAGVSNAGKHREGKRNKENPANRILFDHSADVNRAIALSDAYYGDAGSAVEAVYTATGKPIMRQRVGRGYTSMYVSTGFIEDGDLYGVTLDDNNLVKLDIESGEITYLENADAKAERRFALYVGACKAGNELFFSPYRTDSILAYNTHSGKTRFIPLPMKYAGKPLFLKALALDADNLLFAGYGFPGILLYDVRRNAFEVCDDWPEAAGAVFRADNPNCFIYTAMGLGKTVCAVIENVSALLAFDFETRKAKMIEIGRDSCNYSAMGFDGAYVWLAGQDLTTKKSFVIKWKEDEAPFEIPLPIDYADTDYPINYLLFERNYLWAIPCYGNKILKIDTGSNTVVRSDYFDDYVKEMHVGANKQRFMGAHLVEGKLILVPTEQNEIFLIDTDTDEVARRPIRFNPDVSLDFVLSGGPTQENELIGIGEFCDFLVRNSHRAEPAHQKKPKYTQAGASIYSHVKGLLSRG